MRRLILALATLGLIIAGTSAPALAAKVSRGAIGRLPSSGRASMSRVALRVARCMPSWLVSCSVMTTIVFQKKLTLGTASCNNTVSASTYAT